MKLLTLCSIVSSIFLQEKYHEDLKENCGDTLKWLPLSNEEQQVLNRMERRLSSSDFVSGFQKKALKI